MQEYPKRLYVGDKGVTVNSVEEEAGVLGSKAQPLPVSSEAAIPVVELPGPAKKKKKFEVT